MQQTYCKKKMKKPKQTDQNPSETQLVPFPLKTGLKSWRDAQWVNVLAMQAQPSEFDPYIPGKGGRKRLNFTLTLKYVMYTQ